MGWVVLILLIVFIAPFSIYCVIHEQKTKHIERSKEVLYHLKKYSDAFYRQFYVFFDIEDSARVSNEIDYFFRFIAVEFIYFKKYDETKENECVKVILEDIENIADFFDREEIYLKAMAGEIHPRLDWSLVDLPDMTESMLLRTYCVFGDILYNKSLQTLDDYEEAPMLIKGISDVMSYSQTFKLGHYIFMDYCSRIHGILGL